VLQAAAGGAGLQCIIGFLGRHGKQGFSCGQVPKSSSKSTDSNV
jgi:hypothetical protein